jgi:thiamine-phosphate pyrophosphorylase
MTEAAQSTRLFLVAPASADAPSFPARFAEALSAGDVAAVLLPPDPAGLAAELVAIAQKAGAAALVADDTRIAGRLGADGVHVGTGLPDVRRAVESFRPNRIVGAGNLYTRHAAMEAGEAGVDYVFFGRPRGDTHPDPHPKALDLAEWWSELMEVPAVVMAGRSLDSVELAVRTGAAFVALHEAVWSHGDGPAEALRKARRALDIPKRRVA